MADDLARNMAKPQALQDTVGMRAHDMQQVSSSIRTLSAWSMAQIYSLPMLSSAARDSVGESPSPAGVRALVIRVMGYIFSYAIVWGRVDPIEPARHGYSCASAWGAPFSDVTVNLATDQVANQDVLRLE